MHAFDCGARAATVTRDQQYFPFHGCDRLTTIQVEFQSSFPFARNVADRLGLGSWLTNSVRWSAFFDAGRAWTESESRNGRTDGLDGFAADAGLGLRLGPLGLYWAVPLSGSEHQYNFFLRLGPRL
jgi:outer membrane protein assembly factor BamA